MAFDRERFAKLLERAKGNRSINHYGLQCGVNPGYISRLMRGLRETPPSADVINKLAAKAHNGVTVEALMEAAGYLPGAETSARERMPINLEDVLREEDLHFNKVPMSERDKQSVLEALQAIWRMKQQGG